MASIFEELDTETAAAAATEADATQTGTEDAFAAARAGYLNALRQKAVELMADNNFDLNEADIRFSTALHLSQVRNALVAIVGAGGLGNWQWRILAAMGFKRIAIYDDDAVGIENIGPQAHSIFDIGMPKVEAVANAALAYRGIQVIARNRRVGTFRDIVHDLGEVPDIVIGCTDSAEFRNGFITDLFNQLFNSSRSDFKRFPELFLDYRMALGDWVGYLVPMRSMCAQLSQASGALRAFHRWYVDEAVFPPEEAMQEPCTERAIAYTGANVASFTGAALHWLYSGGRARLHDYEYLLKHLAGDGAWPPRRISFSSRDFEFISETRTEKKLRAKIAQMKKERNAPHKAILLAYGLDNCDCLDFGAEPVNFVELCRKYCSNYIILLGSHKVHLLCETGVLDAHVGDGGYTCSLQGEIHVPAYEPYVIVSPLEELRDRGVLFMASRPVGTVFLRDWNGGWYRLAADGIEELLDGEYRKITYEEAGDLFASSMTPVDDPETLANAEAAFRRALIGEEAETGTELRPVTTANLKVGMWITLSDESDAERLQVVSIGQHVRVHDGSEEYNLSRRASQHMYEVRVVAHYGEEAA